MTISNQERDVIFQDPRAWRFFAGLGDNEQEVLALAQGATQAVAAYAKQAMGGNPLSKSERRDRAYWTKRLKLAVSDFEIIKAKYTIDGFDLVLANDFEWALCGIWDQLTETEREVGTRRCVRIREWAKLAGIPPAFRAAEHYRRASELLEEALLDESGERGLIH